MKRLEIGEIIRESTATNDREAHRDRRLAKENK